MISRLFQLDKEKIAALIEETLHSCFSQKQQLQPQGGGAAGALLVGAGPGVAGGAGVGVPAGGLAAPFVSIHTGS